MHGETAGVLILLLIILLISKSFVAERFVKVQVRPIPFRRLELVQDDEVREECLQ
jgi:hypothetical protein